jgi:zinc D-Ala-D-Ala dipeptidase
LFHQREPGLNSIPKAFKETTYWMKNKILKEALKHTVCSGIFLLIFNTISAQNLPVSPYGLEFINSISLYNKSLVGHPEKKMLPLSQIPGVILDLRYATENNFMHKKLYSDSVQSTYLRKPAYMALDSVAREMARRGLVLVIFDAYRPYSVTEELWIKLKDERYAANPAKGSGHNRGIGVDLTLADAKTHQLLPMPTGFDDFTDSAYQDFKGANKKAIANRELLKGVMKKYGFIPLFSEWWHYSWPQTGDFEVLDLSFQQLDKVSK